MKILLLADEPEATLWEHLDRRRLEGVELIISCGDLPSSYLSFLTCFTSAPIVYVRGNHDGRYEMDPPEGCICLEDNVFEHEGVRIAGLGGSMRYNQGSNQYTEGQMRSRIRRLWWKILLFGGVDILVTHAPAHGLGDGNDLAHRGFAAFLGFIDRYHPDLMVHGHMHANYRYDFTREQEYHGTRIINGYGAFLLEYEPPATKPAGLLRRIYSGELVKNGGKI